MSLLAPTSTRRLMQNGCDERQISNEFQRVATRETTAPPQELKSTYQSILHPGETVAPRSYHWPGRDPIRRAGRHGRRILLVSSGTSLFCLLSRSGSC